MLRVPRTNDDIDPLPTTHPGKSVRQQQEEADKANPQNKLTNLHDNIFVDMMGRLLNLPPVPTTPRTKAEADKLVAQQKADKVSTKVERTGAFMPGDVVRHCNDASDDVHGHYRMVASYAKGNTMVYHTNGVKGYAKNLEVVLPAGSSDWIPFTATADSKCPKGIEDWVIEAADIMKRNGSKSKASDMNWTLSVSIPIAFWRPVR